MKKLTALTLSFCLSLSLTGCANGGASAETAATLPDNEWGQKVAATTAAAEPEDDPWVVMPEFNRDATIEQTILIEQDGIKITATELTYDDYSATVHLLMENNGDKNLSIICGSLGYSCNSVNGFMIPDGYVNCELAPGKKTNETIDFSTDMLLFYGIQEIADLELGFYFTDDDYHSTYLKPCRLKTSLCDSHNYDTPYFEDSISSKENQKIFQYSLPFFSTESIYEEKGVKILSRGILKKGDQDPVAFLEVCNSTEQTVGIELSGITVNGLIVYSGNWSQDDINPGCTGLIELELPSAFGSNMRNAYGITEITSLGCTLTQVNDDDDPIAEPARITVEPPKASNPLLLSGKEVYSKNGLRILMVPVIEDDSEYSDDLHVLLLAENHSGLTLHLDDIYDSLSVNGFMADYYFGSLEVPDGTCGILVFSLDDDWLAKNDIHSPADITQAEFQLEIKSGRTELEKTPISIVY